MSKRFTETAKWKDPWWRKLPPEYKSLWQYICDECDNSGVWTKDFEQAVFNIGGEAVTEGEALKLFNNAKERIIILNNGAYWLIRDFVSFQFGELREGNRPHQHVINLIKKHRVSKGYPKGIDTLKDKDQDKDKVKDKDKVRYGEYVYLSDKQMQTLIYDYGPTKTKEYIARLEEYIGTNPEKHGRKYTSHYHVMLTWMRKDAVRKVEHPKKEERRPDEPLIDPAVMHKMVQDLSKKLGGTK